MGCCCQWIASLRAYSNGVRKSRERESVRVDGRTLHSPPHGNTVSWQAKSPQRSPSKSFVSRIVYWLVTVCRGRSNVHFRIGLGTSNTGAFSCLLVTDFADLPNVLWCLGRHDITHQYTHGSGTFQAHSTLGCRQIGYLNGLLTLKELPRRTYGTYMHICPEMVTLLPFVGFSSSG